MRDRSRTRSTLPGSHKKVGPSAARSPLGRPRAGRGIRGRSFLLFGLFLLAGIGWWLCHPPRADEDTLARSCSADQSPRDGAAWRSMSPLLASRLPELQNAGCLEVTTAGGSVLTLHTALDPEIQGRVQGILNRSQALGAGVAVLEPLSGRVIALATYNRDPTRPLVFSWKAYPAASLIKVITAAAAIEKRHLEPSSILTYTGGPYSLRHKDLGSQVHRWATRVTLENAFARSLNTVFGKVGIHELGADALREFGRRFFFNQPLPCEVPFETSFFPVPEDRFGIAQAASGYNQRTLITTLHAAWIAALVCSGGASPTPWLIERVEGQAEATAALVQRPGVPIRVLSSPGARKMQRLMEATISEGTCQRSFAGRHRIARFRSLTFGGKTGNINDQEQTVKNDWFMGYARDASGHPLVALSVFVLHEMRLGLRANRVAFEVFQAFFQDREGAPSSRP